MVLRNWDVESWERGAGMVIEFPAFAEEAQPAFGNDTGRPFGSPPEMMFRS
jgi:hypothetical protein